MRLPSPERMDRRRAVQWMLTAAAGFSLSRYLVFTASAADTQPAPATTGYGTDPDLTKSYHPGDLWPLTLKEEQRDTAAALCDTILPADEISPSASALSVHDFIDEWISSPYPDGVTARPLILDGLQWINSESKRRFEAEFRDLTEEQRHNLCDDICFLPKAKPEFRKAAEFFNAFRLLAMAGYYSTPEGMKAIGYIGNVPRQSFEAAPVELLQKLGLA